MQENAPPDKKPYYTWKWARLRACQLLVIALLIVSWRSYVNAIPDIVIPPSVPPSPNGYDYFLKASRVWVKPPSEIDEQFDIRYPKRGQPPFTYPLAPKEKWLKANASALRLLRLGLKYSCLLPRQPLVNGYAKSREFSSKDLVRTLVVEAEVYEAHKQWRQALGSLMDGIAMGYAIRHGGDTWDRRIAMACTSICRKPLRNILLHLTPLECKSAVQRLDMVFKNDPPLWMAVQAEKYSNQREAVALMNSEDWQSGGGLAQRNTWLSVKEFIRAASVPKRSVLQDMTQDMDFLTAQARLTYQKRHAVPSDRISHYHSYLLPDFIWDTRGETDDRLLLVQLALQGYLQEHGGYPSSLQQLVPAYLQVIPTDPFGHDTPLHYLRKNAGQSFVLYSVGPDGIDDGGRIICTCVAGSTSYYIQTASKGDFVADINY